MTAINPILLAIILLAALGLAAGLILAIASIVMAVPVDEKQVKIRECLPGANCGACGFSGCDGYASALAKGEAKETNLCAPGGNEVAKQVAAVLGVEAGEVRPMAAVVLCQGHHENAPIKLDYTGLKSCRMAAQLFGGPKDCVYGCLGFGDCVEVCEFNAIHICNGVARINPSYCRACKKCVNACPKHLIELMPLHETKAAVLCKNRDKGAFTRKACKVGCIGCMKCEKNCEQGAIKVENNVAHVDYDKCVFCGKCIENCPVKCISIVEL